ncbi:hypothetical protein QR685DRAFT_532519 [Neurospora intermedia]|uniref:Uncharacterized protein n=1 Tax=Neurospora intermedia TaxID=5142 RepID=A0ABR3D412_NEUIN
MMDLDGFLDEKEAMPVQGPRDRSIYVYIFLGDDCTGRSFWSRVWGSSSFQTFDFDRHSSRI